jgi:hypothetical protein
MVEILPTLQISPALVGDDQSKGRVGGGMCSRGILETLVSLY